MKFNGLEKNLQRESPTSRKRPKIEIPNKKMAKCSEESDFITIMDGLQQIENAKEC